MADLNSTMEHIREIEFLLERVESDLKSAKNWGLFDIFGGKAISSLVKQSKVSDAEKRYREVNRELNILKEELSFLDIPEDLSFKTGSINIFLDIFSDNIFSDLYSQSKINNGVKEIRDLRDMLGDLYRELENM